MLKAAVIVVLLLAPGVLLYGYWHASTHATLYVSFNEASADGRGDKMLAQGEVSFLDGSGKVVAKARPEGPYGTMYLVEPAEYSCRELEQKAPFDTAARDAWRQCFNRQSRWLASQLPEITSLDITSGACRLQAPARFSVYSDWWLWWVPSPHVGGTPYRNYSIYLRIDTATCSAIRA